MANYNKNSNNRRPRGNKGGSNSSASDVSWYGSDINISNAANLVFPAATGSSVHLQTRNYGSYDIRPEDDILPGSINFLTMPTYGGAIAGDTDNVLRTASNNIYNFVRHMNSGASNYDAPDLMMYLIALDSIHMYHSFLKRIYGLLQKYSATNYNTPEMLIRSMGVDFNDVQKHIPDLITYINLFATKANVLVVPDVLPIYKRHVKLFDYVYMDSEGDKPQFYTFTPSGYYKMVAEQGTLEFDRTSNNMVANTNLWTFDSLVAYGNTLLDTIRYEEDFNIMSGDIMKAYQGNVFVLDQIDSSYTTDFVYDKDMLRAIHNATIVGTCTNYGVKQNGETGNIINPIHGPGTNASTTSQIYYCDKLLDIDDDNPTPKDVMNMTRFVAIPVDSRGSNTSIVYNSCGSELLEVAVLWRRSKVTQNNQFTYITFTSVPFYMENVPDATTGYIKLSSGAYVAHAAVYELQAFEYAPMMYTPVVWSDHQDLYISGEKYNITTIDFDRLRIINTMAVLSLFGIQ